MGIDAVIRVEGDLTINSLSPWFGQWRDNQPDTDQRYYGPNYRRGHWPTLYKEIRQAQHLFPKATIYYSDDHADPDYKGDECTPEFLESMWQDWLNEGWD